jgi:hypothetical protein
VAAGRRQGFVRRGPDDGHNGAVEDIGQDV